MATDDARLLNYLVGNLPDEEIERLDELSVTDEHFAQRVREAEYELVDRYARGELTGDLQNRVQTGYQASERGRSRVQFAMALHALTRDPARPLQAVSLWRGTMSRAFRSWGLPAAAFAVAVTIVLLLTSNARLRRDVGRLASERESASAAGAQLRRELASRSSNVAAPTQPTTALFLLRAPKRDAGRIPSIEVPRNAERIALNVQLESDDFTAYYAAVKSTEDPRVLWRSADLPAGAGADGPVVPVTLPAAILTPGRHVLELVGRSRSADEPLAGYPFDIVVK